MITNKKYSKRTNKIKRKSYLRLHSSFLYQTLFFYRGSSETTRKAPFKQYVPSFVFLSFFSHGNPAGSSRARVSWKAGLAAGLPNPGAPRRQEPAGSSRNSLFGANSEKIRFPLPRNKNGASLLVGKGRAVPQLNKVQPSQDRALESPRNYRINKEKFNFRDYWDYLPSHMKKFKRNNSRYYCNFLEWFIGFAEGDGCFCIKSQTPNSKKRLLFEIGQKDPKVLFWIKKMLGFGRVQCWTCSSTEKVFWVYTVDTKPNVKRIIALFNGNMILPKRRFIFKNWVEEAAQTSCLPLMFNNKQQDINHGISVSLDTAWLAGFIDAEGCFYARFSTPTPNQGSKISKVVKQKMHITQKSLFSDEMILQDIGDLFLSNAKVTKLSARIREKPTFQSILNPAFSENLTNQTFNFRIEISALQSQLLIIKYLSKFHLKTNKWIAFSRWKRIVLAREKKEHLVEARLPKLLKLAESINNF